MEEGSFDRFALASAMWSFCRPVLRFTMGVLCEDRSPDKRHVVYGIMWHLQVRVCCG